MFSLPGPIAAGWRLKARAEFRQGASLKLTLRDEDKLQSLLTPVQNLNPDILPVLSPAHPHYVLHPGEQAL